VEKLRVAQVRDHLTAVDVGFKKAQLHPVERRHQRERAVVHHLGGFRFENAIAVIFAILQMRNHEVRHVLAGRRQ